jgi:starvation-inducible DNA-binding protein
MTALGPNASKDISGALNALLADTFTALPKTKNFHWHISGPHFRDHHLLFEDQATEILAVSDEIAERGTQTGRIIL